MVIAARWLVSAHWHQQGAGNEQGAVRERTDGLALPRCFSSAGRTFCNERVATHTFLGAHLVQLELSVRATICDQRVATVGADSGAL